MVFGIVIGVLTVLYSYINNTNYEQNKTHEEEYHQVE